MIRFAFVAGLCGLSACFSEAGGFAAAGRFSLVDCGGVPRLAVDGEPVAGMCALPKPGLPPDRVVSSMKDFADCGVRVFSDVWFGRDRSSSSVGDAGNDWWLGDGKYDFAAFDRRIQALLAASPGALAFPRIKFDQPSWWVKDHGGELRGSEVRPDSQAWRRLYSRMLTDVVRHVESSAYADRVVGYHLAAMHCGEWLLGSFPMDSLPAAECDVRDPLPGIESTAASRKALAEYPRLIADALLDAAALVKRETGRRKLVGAFFGYMGKWAHDDFARVLRSPDVDFFASPANYGRIRRGGGCASLQAYATASFRLHGKLYYEEADPRTWLSPQMVSHRCATPEESVNVVKRSLGFMLSGGFETWWFLLGGNESFKSPLLMEPIKVALAEEARTLRTAPPPTAEVAVFTSASEYSTCAAAHCGSDLMREVCNYDLPRTIFPFAGPHDSYELADVEEASLPDYKVYVFANAFTLTEKQREAVKRLVRRRGRTAIWLFAPGYYRNGCGNASNVVELTGVDVVEVDPLAENRVSRLSRTFEVVDSSGPSKDFPGGWRSVFFATPPSVGDLRRAYAEAGAHQWTDTPEVVAAGRGYLTVHATCDGKKTICLPRRSDVREIYGAAEARRGVESFCETMKKGDTLTFHVVDSQDAAAPGFECSDKEIEKTYAFRWDVFRRHVKNTENGFVVTEFTPDVYWSGKHNTINCAAGHHLMEARWLHDARVFRDYLKFYFRAGRMAGRGAYVSWPAYAALEFVKTSGDASFAKEVVRPLAFNYEDWERGWRVLSYGGWRTFLIGFDAEEGLFRVTDEYEGAENSVSGDGFRPLVNAAMYGEAFAISELARMAGRADLAAEYGMKAAKLADGIRAKLWNAECKFFNTLGPDGRLVPTRELFGYAPWYFDVPLGADFAPAFDQMFSEGGFSAPFGLTGVERRDPAFKIEYDLEGPAVKRNGPTWPYETTVALRALERAIRRGEAGDAGRRGYAGLLRQYAASQRLVLEDGTTVPWIDEDLDPFTGKWIAREVFARRGDRKKMGRGRDYNHSGFCDLVICGLCGLVPRVDDMLEVRPLASPEMAYFKLSDAWYHGRKIAVEWDRDGTRYGRVGLSVYVDGKLRAHAPGLEPGVLLDMADDGVR